MKRLLLFIGFGVILFSYTCTKKVTESIVPGAGTISGMALLADTFDHSSITIEIDPDNQIYSTVRINPDLNGFYSVSDLPVGTYTVRGQKYTYTTFEQTDVVVEGGKTTEVDMVLNRAVAELIFDYFEAELYYFVNEDSMYCNYCYYKVIFHFKNYDGAWIRFGLRYPRGGFESGGPPHFLKAGQVDTIDSYTGGGSSNPEGVLPPDITVSVEAYFEGLFLIHEHFDTTGAILFEASTYDTITVIDGRPPYP